MTIHPAIIQVVCLLLLAVISGASVMTYRHYREQAVIDEVMSRANVGSGPSEWSKQQMKQREMEIRFEGEMNRMKRSIQNSLR